jgi:GT2 family glycosyltransferase
LTLSKNPCKLAVVLLTYNNQDLLEQFLPGLISTLPNREDIKLFVVDNASTDSTQEYLQQFKHHLTSVKVEINRGFTNGYKIGLAQIEAEYYCLLSSDVEVSPGWIEPVIEMFDSDENIAIIQPKIKSWHRKTYFEYAGASGGLIDYQGYPFCRGRIFYTLEEDLGQYDDPMEIFWASGACFFIQSKLYHSSGGLDDDFYAHMEEIDLCWRIKNQGYKVMVCPASEVFHMGGAVIAYGSPQKVFRNHRNNLIMLMKNLPQNEIVGKIIVRLLMDALAFGNMIIRGQVVSSFSIIHAHWSFFWDLPRWIKKRKESQKNITRHATIGMYANSIVKAYFLDKKQKFSNLSFKN